MIKDLKDIVKHGKNRCLCLLCAPNWDWDPSQSWSTVVNALANTAGRAYSVHHIQYCISRILTSLTLECPPVVAMRMKTP